MTNIWLVRRLAVRVKFDGRARPRNRGRDTKGTTQIGRATGGPVKRRMHFGDLLDEWMTFVGRSASMALQRGRLSTASARIMS